MKLLIRIIENREQKISVLPFHWGALIKILNSLWIADITEIQMKFHREGISQKRGGIIIIIINDLAQFNEKVDELKVEGSNEENRFAIIFNFFAN